MIPATPSGHPDFLRTPENACLPDPRNNGGLRTIQRHHDAIAEIVLHGGAPEAVRIQFETVKNVYFYSWFVYRFHSVTRLAAYACLEFALKKRFAAELSAASEKKREHGPSLRRLMKYALDTGHLRNEGFELWQRKTAARTRQRTIIEQITEMQRLGLHEMSFDHANVQITDEDKAHDYVHRLVDSLPDLRNHFAHGSRSLDHQSIAAIRVVAEVINQVYPR
jgi:hypothetical protein